MLADNVDGARLRPFVAKLFDEADFGAYLQLIEIALHDRVAVKIDFTAVPRFDKAAILAGQETRHAAVRRLGVLFHFAAEIAHRVLDLADRGVEGVTDGDDGMFMFGLVAMASVDNNVFASRHGDAQRDMKKVSMLMSRGLGDGQVARGDPVAELFEPSDLSDHLSANGVRRLVVTKGDFRWRLHGLPHLERDGGRAPRSRVASCRRDHRQPTNRPNHHIDADTPSSRNIGARAGRWESQTGR